MCKTRKDALAAPPERKPRTPRRSSPFPASTLPPSSSTVALSASFRTTATDVDANTGRAVPGSSSSKPTSSSTSSGHVSIASLREFLPEPPSLYDFSEICSATNNFLAKRLSSSTSNSWRCTLRGKDAVVFQRRFRGEPATLRGRLAAASKIHHNSVVRLLGAALGGDYIYLAYEYVHGASLADCLRNPHNPAYTPLAAWVDRMQVATDLAQGLQYIHHFTATGMEAPPTTPHKSPARKGASRRRHPVHNRIKSSSVMITEPHHRAKICHFAATELAGEISTSSDSDDEGEIGVSKHYEISEIHESPHATPPSKLRRAGSRRLRFEGTRGYIAPEIRDGGSPSQKSDVFAFGVVLLELLTGEEPVKYRYNRERKGYERVSLIETAREVMGGGEEEGEAEEDAEGEAEAGGRVASAGESHQVIRRWVDRRLGDSFPVEVAERAARVALECVQEEAEERPDMVRVAGKLSRLLLKSRAWAEKVAVPAEFTVSNAPR